MAYYLAVRINLLAPFNNGEGGRARDDLFLNYHKYCLSLQRICGIFYAKSLGFTNENMDAFFILLEETFNKRNFSVSRVYNVDEKGFLLCKVKFCISYGKMERCRLLY